jgi:peptide/nickel transport system permease protein
MKRRWRNPSLVAGATIVCALAAAAAFGPLAAPKDPLAINLDLVFAPIGWAHPLGCDELGRDVLARLLWGARISLSISAAVVAVSVVVGSIIGGTAALLGGALDELTMRLIDVLLAFPGILFALALAAILGPGLLDLAIALCAIGWTGYARLVRGEILSLRERDYVVAARALGSRTGRLLWRHLLPALAGPLIVRTTFGVAAIIVAEAALSFLGLGARLPTPTWGNMLDEGRAFLLTAPNLTAAPVVAIGLSVLGFNLLGDGLNRALDWRG